MKAWGPSSALEASAVGRRAPTPQSYRSVEGAPDQTMRDTDHVRGLTIFPVADLWGWA